MNPKVRKISYKLYLSAQGLVALIGVGVLIWNLVAATHDLYISSKGKQCIESIVGVDTIKAHSKDNIQWTNAAEHYAEILDHPSKKYALQELIKRQCSDYMHMSIYEYDGSVGIYVNGYMDGTPAVISKRLWYLALTIGITLLIIGSLFGLMRWISWLLKE